MKVCPAKLVRLTRWGGWVRHIFRCGARPYLDRYSLRKQNPSGENEKRVYLHEFLDSDDEHLHNHPFRWAISFVLLGSYTEELPGRSRRVRWFNFITPSTYHRIAKLHPAPGCRGVWTLFIAGPLARKPDGTKAGWGFLLDGKHVDYRDIPRTTQK